MPMAVPQLTQEQRQKAFLRVPGTRPSVDPKWLAIAAGDLHTEGKLFMPSTVVPGNPQASNPDPAVPDGK